MFMYCARYKGEDNIFTTKRKVEEEIERKRDELRELVLDRNKVIDFVTRKPIQ